MVVESHGFSGDDRIGRCKGGTFGLGMLASERAGAIIIVLSGSGGRLWTRGEEGLGGVIGWGLGSGSGSGSWHSGDSSSSMMSSMRVSSSSW